jgi:hypothetical protein
MTFLALFITLSTKQSAGRMRIWRALRSLGSATLRDGVYLLPESPQHLAALTECRRCKERLRAPQKSFCSMGATIFSTGNSLRSSIEARTTPIY